MKLTPTLAALTLAAALAACGNADGPRADNDTEARIDALEAEAAELDARANEMADTMSDTTYGSGSSENSLAGEMERASYDVVNSSGIGIGTVLIVDTVVGVDVALDVNDIPEGEHAIHFHENGTCDGPDFTSAGGHYNPGGTNHGFEAAAPNPHAGDMRNFEAPQSGRVQTILSNERVSLSERDGMAPLRDGNGTALIIHAGADDYQSQPSGAAGGRIACAVID